MALALVLLTDSHWVFLEPQICRRTAQNQPPGPDACGWLRFKDIQDICLNLTATAAVSQDIKSYSSASSGFLLCLGLVEHCPSAACGSSGLLTSHLLRTLSGLGRRWLPVTACLRLAHCGCVAWLSLHESRPSPFSQARPTDSFGGGV